MCESNYCRFESLKNQEGACIDIDLRSIYICNDSIVLATGYQQPSLDMLPPDLFPTEGDRTYARPNLYLQTFSTEDWSILLTNAAYKNAIGSVGNWHIGCYSRLLMVFLRDPSTRPSPRDMKLWVDVISWLKISSFGPGKDA